MSETISPLAPKKYPTMPAIEGVGIATAEAGIKYKNRTDLLAMVFDAGTEVAGVFTRSKCPSAPVDFCRENLARRQGADAGRQFRQRQRLYRQTRPRNDDHDRQGGGASGRLHGRGGVPGLDRRHRRAARCGPFRASPGRHGQGRKARPVAGGGQGDHDHRHLSQSRDGDGQARRGRCHDQRHRQGRRHDRARHGDDAVLRGDRRADFGCRSPGAAFQGRRPDLQRGNRRQRHLDQRHAAVVCHRSGGKARRAEDQTTRRIRASPLSGAA